MLKKVVLNAEVFRLKRMEAEEVKTNLNVIIVFISGMKNEAKKLIIISIIMIGYLAEEHYQRLVII